MFPFLERSERIFGREALERLAAANVAIFGLGGVGAFAAEALARAGVGRFLLVDHDVIEFSNINRQLLALNSTIGKPKVDLMRSRILDINPAADVCVHQVFYGAHTDGSHTDDLRTEASHAENLHADKKCAEEADEASDLLLDESIDYVVDAIDTISAKAQLIERALALNIPLVSCLGTGNKIDPRRLRLADLSETHTCPLARALRQTLRKRGIEHVHVVFSDEQKKAEHGAHTPGSTSVVPPTAGFLLAAKVIWDLTGVQPERCE